MYLQQPNLSAESRPPQQTPCSQPPGNRLCPCGGGSLWLLVGRTQAVSQWWSVWARGSPGEGLEQDPLPGTPKETGQCFGPRSADSIFCGHPGVSVCCGSQYVTCRPRRGDIKNPEAWTQMLGVWESGHRVWNRTSSQHQARGMLER